MNMKVLKKYKVQDKFTIWSSILTTFMIVSRWVDGSVVSSQWVGGSMVGSFNKTPNFWYFIRNNM